MARTDTAYVCQTCGAAQPKWAGKCDACGGWNTLQEETARTAPGGSIAAVASDRRKSGSTAFTDLRADTERTERLVTGLEELDRVTGGGFVEGSALLVGGDPGIGKSTLLLQAAAALARRGVPTVYVTGEESEAQVQARAARLGVADAPVRLAAETDLRAILRAFRAEAPKVAIIDSIQTLWSDAIEAAPGTVTQVRACAHDLARFAKKSGCTVVLVGHVTKDGQIAGPRVVEHLVDAVLYFEGERGHQFRLLRAVKNRFGPTDEIGVFEMAESGLREVANPSSLFLDEGAARAAGTAVFAGVEGSRPILVEIQALAAPSTFGTPRRSAVGWDGARLAMLIAVLETRCGLSFAHHDIYLGVAGGLKITDPAADLSVAAALVSALTDRTLGDRVVAFGEIALSGQVRPAGRAEARLREAARLGFREALCPVRTLGMVENSFMVVEGMGTVQALVERITAGSGQG